MRRFNRTHRGKVLLPRGYRLPADWHSPWRGTRRLSRWYARDGRRLLQAATGASSGFQVGSGACPRALRGMTGASAVVKTTPVAKAGTASTTAADRRCTLRRCRMPWPGCPGQRRSGARTPHRARRRPPPPGIEADRVHLMQICERGVALPHLAKIRHGRDKAQLFARAELQPFADPRAVFEELGEPLHRQ